MTTIAAATMPAVEATAPVTKVSKFLPNCAALARSLAPSAARIASADIQSNDFATLLLSLFGEGSRYFAW